MSASIPRSEFDAEPSPVEGTSVAARVQEWLQPHRPDMLRVLGELVALESPSDDKPLLDAMARALEELFGPAGRLERITPNPERGSHLQLSIAGEMGSERGTALVLCHYDTVWPAGTLTDVPFSVDEQGVARGPGCFDMKGGIVLLYWALRALQAVGVRPRRNVRVLFTSDEEEGSVTSRPYIEGLAREAAVAYVLESPLPGGGLKTARKGTGDYLIRVDGRAAHAGIEPEKGVNALVELAHQVLALQALNRYEEGTSVTVGVARGGTRPNVVPSWAEAQVDVRVSSLAEAERLDEAFRNLTPHLPDARLHIEGGLNRPPMERSQAMGRLFERAKTIARGAGIEDLCEGGTGGGSDGNFTAALGVPTLDGLGAEGEGAHALTEKVYTESLPRRAALIAGLLAEI